MEIERKYLIPKLPENLFSYNFHEIEQGYLSTDPVIRVRKEDDSYYLTYKSQGLMVREEYNLPLTKESYEHLVLKADGNIISKKRYLLPIENSLVIELDVFHDVFSGLVIAEVEFSDKASADAFVPPDWFGEEVTYLPKYHNSSLSRMPVSEIKDL